MSMFQLTSGRIASVSAVLLALVGLGCSSTPEMAAPQLSGYLADLPDMAPASNFAPVPMLEDNFDLADWPETQTLWEVATWMQNKTQMDPSRCKTDGNGMLVQTVLAGEPNRGGSMQTADEYPYGRWIARVKPSPVPGVLNSIFTVDWDDKTTDEKNDGSKFEVDIEFLTYTFSPGNGKVHLAIHLPGKKNLFVDDVELGFNPSDDFHNWGFDIMADKVVWHVDGKVLRSFDRPEDCEFPDAYEFFFNSWTSKKWINGPSEQDADYYINWVRFYPLLEQQAD